MDDEAYESGLGFEHFWSVSFCLHYWPSVLASNVFAFYRSNGMVREFDPNEMHV
jgi:hypothetical protein